MSFKLNEAQTTQRNNILFSLYWLEELKLILKAF